MATIINEDEGQTPREKHPAGMVQAILCAVEDVGIQKGEWQGQAKNRRKLILVWETAEMQADGTPFILTKKYTASMSEKAVLRADLEGWNGKAFTPEELKAFDVDKFIGKNCLLNVVHSEDGKYANIAGVTPVMKGMQPIKAYHKALPDGLAKWIQKMRSEAIGDSTAPSTNPEDNLPF